MFLFKQSCRISQTSRTNLRLEQLESRVVPYSTSGNLWPASQLITLSFMPDGTDLGGISSNLFANFNSRFGSPATWQNQILKAAQVWAPQTNINFAVVPDNGAPSGSGDYQQGDAGFGDIRFGGYNFGSGSLGLAFLPPPVNNYSIAGDIAYNTGQPFNIGTTYDLFTVSVHEIGHSLGLLHSTVSTANMYAAYTNVKSALVSDDISGIRNIYSNSSPRSTDAYGSTNNTFATAVDVSSLVDTGNLTALMTSLDITGIAQKDYFKLTAPSGTSSTVNIRVQSNGLSLLAPTLYVYAANQSTVLGSISGSGQYGATLTLNLTNKILSGDLFYIRVAGADNTSLGTGTYAMSMTFGAAQLPAVPLPNTQLPNGNPLSGGGGIAMADEPFTPGQAGSEITLDQLEAHQHGGGCGCSVCQNALNRFHDEQKLMTALEEPSPAPSVAIAVTSASSTGNRHIRSEESYGESVVKTSQGFVGLSRFSSNQATDLLDSLFAEEEWLNS